MKKHQLIFTLYFCFFAFITEAQTVKDKLDSIVVERYDNGNPVLDSKREMQYNHDEQLIREVYYTYNQTTSSWDATYSIQYNYDQNGLETMQTFLEWNHAQQVWENTGRILYSYTSTKKLNTVESFIYDAGNWKKLLDKSYTYDMVDNPELEEITFWSGANVTANAKVEYFYHPDYRLSYTISSSNWSGSWKNESRLDYDYAGNKDFMGTRSSVWVENSNSFLQNRHTSYILDFMDNMDNIGEIADMYYADGNTFDSTVYQFFTYDLTVNKADLVYRDDMTFPMTYLNKMVSIRSAVDYVGLGNPNDRINTSMKKYYYSPYTPSSTVIPAGTDPRIYPNPARNELNISNSEGNIDRVIVYDMLGNELLRTDVDNFVASLNIAALPSGTYSLQLEGEGLFYQKKFIKQ